MRKAQVPVPSTAMTVGDLITELCQWPDHAEITFRCPLKQQNLRLFRIQGPSKTQIEIEFDPAPEIVPVLAA